VDKLCKESQKQKDFGSEETYRIIEDLTQGDSARHMYILRFSKNNIGALAGLFLRFVRNKFTRINPNKWPLFGVIADFGTTSLYAAIQADRGLENFRVASSGLTLADINTKVCKGSGRKLQYINLEGLPCLLLLTQKGRMGDTFPQSLRCLDLRVRASENTTTFIQEVGRMCRYPKTKMYKMTLDYITFGVRAQPYFCDMLADSDPLLESLGELRTFESFGLDAGVLQECNSAYFKRGKALAVLKSGGELSSMADPSFMGYATHSKSCALGFPAKIL
jgi:hypothetical protein